MMIAPNSYAPKKGKESGEVEGEYGGLMMMIAPNSRACKEEKERVEIKGEYGRI